LSITNVLQRPDAMASDLSEVDCDRSIDGEQGYFETWQIFADENATVILDAEAEFDSLMKLFRVVEVGEDSLTTELVAENDDRALNDPRARVSATLRKADNYLLRVSGFGDEETGSYTVVATPTDAPAPQPETGSIEVQIEANGELAGYTVTLNGAKRKLVTPDDKATYDDLHEGTYAVELTGIRECTVDGANIQNVVVNANKKSIATFRITCAIPVGTIRVVTETTGIDIDDSYEVRVDGVRDGPIGPNDSRDLPSAPVGKHTVFLIDVAKNCEWVSAQIQDVSVVADSITTVTFTLECFAVGSPRIHSVEVRETPQSNCFDTDFAFEYAIDFTDPNGDVTKAEAVVEFAFVWDTGSTSHETSADPSFHILGGTPSAGTFFVTKCVQFPVFTHWADTTLILRDAAGLASNPYTTRRILKPEE
jgi:hypothetical protein